MNSRPSSNIRSRTNTPNSSSHSRMTKRPTETYPRPVFEPFLVSSKPLHPLVLTGNTHPSKTKFKLMKPPSTAPGRIRSSKLIPSPSKNPAQLLISDPPISSTPSIDKQNIKEENEEVNNPHPIISESSNYPRPVSNMSLRSTIKLESQVPRCRSATDTKSSFSLNKTSPRFILITDDEHRIESWYHRYPFIISNDFLRSFQSKPNKSTISAYFLDDYKESLHLNKITNEHLQGKPFHINNDWNKYDLIFISNNIYQDIIIYLQTIINLIRKSSGKIIHIYQINHHEDLKTQVTYICKRLSNV